MRHKYIETSYPPSLFVEAMGGTTWLTPALCWLLLIFSQLRRCRLNTSPSQYLSMRYAVSGVWCPRGVLSVHKLKIQNDRRRVARAFRIVYYMVVQLVCLCVVWCVYQQSARVPRRHLASTHKTQTHTQTHTWWSRVFASICEAWAVIVTSFISLSYTSQVDRELFTYLKIMDAFYTCQV